MFVSCNVMAKKNDKFIPILSIVFGILVILVPDFLAWFVGIYLIVTGALKLR